MTARRFRRHFGDKSKTFLFLLFASIVVVAVLIFILHSDNSWIFLLSSSQTLLNHQSWVFSMEQEDPRLINYIASEFLTPPSTEPYNFTQKILGGHPNGYSDYIMKLLKKKDGYFVEAGAYDGEKASNSLFLEELGWKGLLVECNPLLVPQLRSKHRKAWISHACLSPSTKPQRVKFSTPVDWPASAKLGRALSLQEMDAGGIGWMKNKTWLHYNLTAFPLYSLIEATQSFVEVDFLSLDVEGIEFDILRNFPFDKISVKVIIVEVSKYSKSKVKEFRKFMSTVGFTLLRNAGDVDHVYIQKRLRFRLHSF